MPLSIEELIHFIEKGYITSENLINTKEIKNLLHQDNHNCKVVIIHNITYYYVYLEKLITNTNIKVSDCLKTFSECDFKKAKRYANDLCKRYSTKINNT